MQLLLVVHVFATMVWIGAIVSVGLLLTAASRAKDDVAVKSTALLSRALYQYVAMPAFVVSFVAAASRLSLFAETYMSLHWMHGKLTAALVVIALHHVIGAKARRAATEASASGSRQAGKSSAILTGATLAFAFVTVSFAILKGQLVP